MSRILAILAGDTVANVILGEPSEFPGADDVTDLAPRPSPGWARVDGGYAAPVVVSPPAPTAYFITEREFMGRWTLPELTAFYALKASDPVVAAADALVTRLGGVQNDSSRTQQLMGYLVQNRVLTAERAVLLLAPPQSAL